MYRSPPSGPPKATDVGLLVGTCTTPSRCRPAGSGARRRRARRPPTASPRRRRSSRPARTRGAQVDEGSPMVSSRSRARGRSRSTRPALCRPGTSGLLPRPGPGRWRWSARRRLGSRQRPSTRYRPAYPGRLSYAMVPTQHRPVGVGLDVVRPVLRAVRLDRHDQVRRPTAVGVERTSPSGRPPAGDPGCRSRLLLVATGSPTRSSAPLTGSVQCTACPVMSTHHRRAVAASQSGPSPCSAPGPTATSTATSPMRILHWSDPSSGPFGPLLMADSGRRVRPGHHPRWMT